MRALCDLDGKRIGDARTSVSSRGCVPTAQHAMREWFDELDTNKDHHLSVDEFRIASGVLQPEASDKCQLALFNCIDLNNDGKLDRSEFHDFMLSSYSKDSKCRVQKLLQAGVIRFLSARWLLARPRPFTLERRQDLPEEAFLTAELAARLWVDDKLSIIILSYGWLSQEHPDPDGFHLSRILHCLKVHRAHFQHQFPDTGLFWDFVSLPQKPRSAEEEVNFRRGLAAMALFYSSTDHAVVQLKEMPANEAQLNLTPYSLRGWCTFEEVVASILKSSQMLLDLRLAATCFQTGGGWLDVTRRAVAGRQPPLHPNRMEELLLTKKFTNDADTSVVARLYRGFFHDVCGAAQRLHFQHIGEGVGWGAKEASQLAEALPEFISCQILILDGHSLEDEGISSIAQALLHMPAVKVVSLKGCGFGEQGLRVLKNQLPHLQMLDRLCLPVCLEESSEGARIDSEARYLTEHGVRKQFCKPLKLEWA